MKSASIGVLGLTIVFGGSSLAAQSEGKTVKAETITCEEFLALDKNVQPNVVEGSSEGAKEQAVLIEAFEQPITVVQTECKKNPRNR
jgi:hypothetical protein